MIILMLFGVVIFSLLSLLIYKKANKNFKDNKKLTAILLSFLVLAVGLEVTVFNVNFYNNFKNEEIPLNHYLEYFELNNKYVLTYENNTLFFPEIDDNIKNIHFDIADINTEKNITVTIKLSDDGNLVTYETPERNISRDVKKSHYINIHPYGNVSGMSVSFDLGEKDVITLNGISLNTKRPFSFSIFRILIVILVCGFVYLFSGKSELNKMKLKDNKETYSVLATFFICVLSGVFAILAVINPLFLGIDITSNGLEFVPLNMQNHNMYDELACAILDGKTYIDNNDVPDSLKELSNPYDTTLRAIKSEQTGDKYRWDVAYFNGHYYVYFGVVPLILMYLPFRVITSSPFPTAVGIIIFAILFTIGVYKLITLIAEKKFKNLTVRDVLLIFITTVISCGLIFLVKRPDFYSIPIITGMTFSVFGIYNWIYGLYNEKNRNLRFFIGSLCMALVAGCRPQMLLLTFLAIPLFFKKYLTDKEIKTKKGILELVLLLSPYVVVAAGLMYYNFIRFSSPFDFGSNYQLTTNDVTNRGMNMGRTGLGFFTYLFQPPVFSAEFPFLEKVTIRTNYVGKTIYENCFGGLITSTPILWFIGLLGKAKNTLKEKKLLSYTILLILSGFILVFFDSQAGGLLQRYISDFGFIFFGAVILIIFALYENVKTENEKSLLDKLTFSSSFLSIFYSFALAFSVSDVTIDTMNPGLFTYLSETVQFWL
ncbi:MAG: hypothetical protein E7556_04340 [Ruminococcaceae bacterium]|nr:hypothetical protein [Oscillospiraceae bacterium]